MFELKPLQSNAVPEALEKAVRYRLLNEPLEAESICRDILEIDPSNQEAVVTLILSLTDQFASRLAVTFEEAQSLASGLESEYEQHYYHGIICERRAKCHLEQAYPGTGGATYDWLRDAMDHYEKAETMKPEGNEEAVLRWNTCVRIIQANRDVRPTEDTFHEPIELE